MRERPQTKFITDGDSPLGAPGLVGRDGQHARNKQMCLRQVGIEGSGEKPGRVGGQRVLVGVLVSFSCYADTIERVASTTEIYFLQSGSWRVED